MNKIAIAGTFDPITNGHLWVIKEGLTIADEVIVMIAHNANKKTLFNDVERKEMIDNVLKEKGIHHKVKTVIIKSEYVAQSALRLGCDYLLRGIRSSLDFDYESLLQKTNTDIINGAKTLFVMPPRELESVSSSFVKALIGPVGWHWYIKDFLPKQVYDIWLKKYIGDMFNHFVKSSEWTQENRELFLHEIFQAYQQPNRFYHTLEHIAHCIQELQWLSANHEGINNTEQLFLALLAHDFIYNSDNKDISDECQSALWFETFLNKINYNKSHTDIIIKMIKATQHFNTEDLTQNDILNILCSIDLSILAQPAKIYKWYKDMVRQEYCFIPDSKFAIGRIKILQKLLSDNIYKSNLFAHYESRAKCNIEEELLLLQQL